MRFFAPCTLFFWGSSVGWTIVFCLLDCCVHTFSAGFRDQLAILGDDPRINRQFLYASQHTVDPSFYLTLPISLSFFSIIISASPSVRLLQHLSFLLSFLSVLLHKNVNPTRNTSSMIDNQPSHQRRLLLIALIVCLCFAPEHFTIQ